MIATRPYVLVRHPIYTGILTRFLGTAIALSQVPGVIGFVLIFAVLWANLRMDSTGAGSEVGIYQMRSYWPKSLQFQNGNEF